MKFTPLTKKQKAQLKNARTPSAAAKKAFNSPLPQPMRAKDK